MTDILNKQSLTKSMVFLRVLIGWHFLYEGVLKLFNPDWTAFGYLATAQGPLQSLFMALTNESVIGWVDALNWAALIFVGVTLVLGYYERLGAVAGMLLLALYYFSHPPFPWLEQQNVEGSYWFVNKNLIELAACWVLYQYPTGHYFGLRYLFKHQTEMAKTQQL